MYPEIIGTHRNLLIQQKTYISLMPRFLRSIAVFFSRHKYAYIGTCYRVSLGNHHTWDKYILLVMRVECFCVWHWYFEWRHSQCLINGVLSQYTTRGMTLTYFASIIVFWLVNESTYPITVHLICVPTLLLAPYPWHGAVLDFTFYPLESLHLS